VEKLRFRSWIAADWWIAPTSDGDSAANEEMKAKQKRKPRELRFRGDVIPINLLISTNLVLWIQRPLKRVKFEGGAWSKATIHPGDAFS